MLLCSYSLYSSSYQTFFPDTTLPYSFGDNEPFSMPNSNKSSALFLKNPSNIEYEITYDTDNNEYIYTQKIGENNYRPPQHLSFEEYLNYDMNSSINNYWNEKSKASSKDRKKSGLPTNFNIGSEVFDRIFGGSTIDIRPSGSAELLFGIKGNRRDDPQLNVKQQRTVNFDFQEKIQMNVIAKIGDKIELGTNYNTEATFDFENKMKLGYEGKEDEIIKLIEAGDVSMPLSGSLITGSQSLFGIKTKLQFGKFTVTSVFSQQKSQASTIEVSGGAQVNTFEMKADQYEENKHFFIAHHFRDNYEKALEDLPLINSRINITKIEVWVTTIGSATKENRNIVSLMDLGENASKHFHHSSIENNSGYLYPDNRANNLYSEMNNIQVRDINSSGNYLAGKGYVSGLEFEEIENARKLNQNEFTFNSKLGFISLKSTISSEQALAVAFQFTVIGLDSTIYQVGDFSSDRTDTKESLILKLLKSTSLNTEVPLWNLMMKNVYKISGAYQVNSEDFRLNILYTDDKLGVPISYISNENNLRSELKDMRYLGMLKLDKLNNQLDRYPDGIFDFIDKAMLNGGTIESSSGRIFFPILEPFGSHLRELINNDAIANKYCYDSLYTLTKNGAQQYPSRNKFLIAGSYKSSVGSEISLNAMNVPQGSVKVTAGGILLTENEQYTVDYALGRVKIIDEGILNSGTPIQISLESNSLFAIQQKTLMGTHVDYAAGKNFNLGATIMRLSERPLTEKINFGNEPIANTIWGVDGTYQTESRLITKIIDKLPLINTKAPSNVTYSGEFAQLIPGHARAIGKTGTAYIDDFEGSKSSIDIQNVSSWTLASTPQGQDLFKEASVGSEIEYGYNRSKLAWYNIDNLFLQNNSVTPSHIKEDYEQQTNHFVREIYQDEIFPNKDYDQTQLGNITILNLSFYPEERGPYNYDYKTTDVSAGINYNGLLKDPETRWGGIMRRVTSTDFEESNVEYIEFWLMDPFIYDPTHSGGELYFNLGDISEDILKDSRKSYENGLPTSAIVEDVDTTIWGRVPTKQSLVATFNDINKDSRKYQDVGFDGLRDEDERKFFYSTFLSKIDELRSNNAISEAAKTTAYEDPSSDNYHYFRGTDFDNASTTILERYKNYNGLEGNSPTDQDSPESYPTSATSLPDIEDINKDNTLNKNERYYQYRIDLKPNSMVVGQNYITDVVEANVEFQKKDDETIKWYQFKIPISSYDKKVGTIQNFKSIRFIRMFLRGFSKPVVCRFASLELVKGQWRRYNNRYSPSGEVIYNVDDKTTFTASVVNIEENSNRSPVPYVVPPGIKREMIMQSTSSMEQNEQSISLKVCNLEDGDERSIYKTADLDVRQYERVKMFVHAEEIDPHQSLEYGDLTVYMRLGSDFTDNYYEYEVPLTFTPWHTDKDSAIWPFANEFDVLFQDLVDVKQERNVKIRQGNSDISLNRPYIKSIGKNKIIVKGVPNLSAIQTIMIGVRNPRKRSINDEDDMLPKCAEIWFNEFRLTDFIEKGGCAGVGRISTDLADLGNLTVAGSFSTAGFGSIEKKVNDRQKENIRQYDVATNIELGKFIPEKIGLKIPLHIDFSESYKDPQFNPLNPDVKFREDLATYETKEERDSIKREAQDYTKRKNINFTNVRKIKTGKGKNHFYDISNFDLTYAYSEILFRNADEAHNLKKNYRGGIGYNFSTTPKKITPFKKSKFLSKNKSLRIIKDFNIYLFPKVIAIRSDFDREYLENQYRKKSPYDDVMDTTYSKFFNWNRSYTVKHDFTQTLKMDYLATVSSFVQEPQGLLDREDPFLKLNRLQFVDTLLDNNRITNFNQRINLNYNIPINKIPLFNWINATTRYSGEYRWNASPRSIQDTIGNVIENSNTKQININTNLINLYNKVGYLKKLNQSKRKQKPKKDFSAEYKELQKSKEDTAKKEPINYPKIIADNTLKLLMSAKNVSFSFSEGLGTLLPGFKPEPVYCGLNPNYNMAPGAGFVLGLQERDMKRLGYNQNIYDIANKWMTRSDKQNQAYALKENSTFQWRGTIEPFKNFRIQLNANRNFTLQSQGYFVLDNDEFNQEYLPLETGSFSTSAMLFKTSFSKTNERNTSEVYQEFIDNRLLIANRLADENLENGFARWNNSDTVGSPKYPIGYGEYTQNVLIPAFLAAYTDKSPEEINLNPIPKKAFPLPNWRITYNGLAKLKPFSKWFKSATINHSYRSSYNVNSFTTNIRYKEDAFVKDMADVNFVPQYDIQQISLTEQFAPLINFDMTWHNSLISKFEIKRSRNLSLSFINVQLTEIISNEFVVGLGYRFKEVPIKFSKQKDVIESDMNVKADFSIRSNKTILHDIAEDNHLVSNGQKIIKIDLSADYMINETFMVRFYFRRTGTIPYTTNIFYNAHTDVGFSLKFTLQQ